MLSYTGIARLQVWSTGIEREKAAGAGVERVLHHCEHFLSRGVVHVAVCVVHQNVILQDVWVEVDRVAQAAPVMLLSLLVG